MTKKEFEERLAAIEDQTLTIVEYHSKVIALIVAYLKQHKVTLR